MGRSCVVTLMVLSVCQMEPVGSTRGCVACEKHLLRVVIGLRLASLQHTRTHAAYAAGDGQRQLDMRWEHLLVASRVAVCWLLPSLLLRGT